ncbi:MAG TPA: UDP-N-acetylglucosamine--N-acetylmuramyl-(pentapeptide) pyrophosphoryl-undecaprenol N-acetylglucosamine transferase [Gaiellaceae bacterium]|nr:UDP-N-acetylglucosamine--N-acetylmuramyl-(pentapeptide) pyrophosphoryl-undecaprenol N-acetylglucosamine transferase [Gaiellaceae bacterium]
MGTERQLRCVIAAGGTAGHVLSALAVAEALTAHGVLVTFAGSPDRVEAQLVPEAGFELDTFRISGFERKPSLALARALGRAVVAPRACRAILRRRKPDVVFGGGGYVAGPMVLAAASLSIPAAVSEADAHLGLANRLAAPLAKRVFLAYPVEGRAGAKYQVVGRPIPARARSIPQAAARELFDLPAEAPVLLVAGALAGARALNELVVDAFAESGPAILHISGDRDFSSLQGRVSRSDYRLIARTDQIGAAYSAADLVLARAGSSVWELAAAGRPAILVPYPFATADHQAKNADYFVRAGGAVMVREDALATVPDLVRGLLDDSERRKTMGEAMLAAALPDAAEQIAKELIALAAV